MTKCSKLNLLEQITFIKISNNLMINRYGGLAERQIEEVKTLQLNLTNKRTAHFNFEFYSKKSISGKLFLK